MTTITETSTSTTVQNQVASTRLRATMAAARLSFTWLGVRKSLNAQQKNQAADSFGAEGRFLSAGKKVIDTTHPAYKAVTAIRSQALSYWKGMSLPFPEVGIRLIRQDTLGEFDARIAGFREQLEGAVLELDHHYDELRQQARERLGDLFDPRDYPPTLLGMFGIEHDYPSIEPPNYLRQLNPELYQQECQRVQARFEEAVQLAEQAFTEELTKLIEHLHERLSGETDGNPKIFRDSAITNLTEFFERFRTLNIRSNAQLDELVSQARGIMQGVQPQYLRDSGVLREQIATQLSAVQTSLDDLLIDRPRRNILRKPR
ncbi:Hypothetical protein PBC10988_3100 [Planctomycetales bacterium 10988]|nr:Hypothetical protein PBC10988_2590 [Planctomycetales bacterium 10988]QGJ68649.1 Hypothetical protein PBC10988_3100 [Planctomycetales bacterium 10988]